MTHHTLACINQFTEEFTRRALVTSCMYSVLVCLLPNANGDTICLTQQHCILLLVTTFHG